MILVGFLCKLSSLSLLEIMIFRNECTFSFSLLIVKLIFNAIED